MSHCAANSCLNSSHWMLLEKLNSEQSFMAAVATLRMHTLRNPNWKPVNRMGHQSELYFCSYYDLHSELERTIWHSSRMRNAPRVASSWLSFTSRLIIWTGLNEDEPWPSISAHIQYTQRRNLWTSKSQSRPDNHVRHECLYYMGNCVHCVETESRHLIPFIR